MAFRAAMVVAYHTHTLYTPKTFEALLKEGEKHESSALIDYSETFNIQNEELRGQAQFLGVIVYQAYQEIQNKKYKTAKYDAVMKIFVAPEFLFRPTTKNEQKEKAFTMTDRDELMRALNVMFSNPLLKSWVFVPGSVIWQWDKPLSDTHIVMNTAMLKQGGTRTYKTTSKNAAAGADRIDFMYQPQRLTKEDRGTLYQPFEDRILKANGIYNIGVEICMDHELNSMYLKDGMTDYKEAHESFDLDIHILTACGMPTRMASQSAKAGGLFVRLDGTSWDPGNCEFRVSTKQSYGWDPKTFARLKSAEYTFYRKAPQERTAKREYEKRLMALDDIYTACKSNQGMLDYLRDKGGSLLGESVGFTPVVLDDIYQRIPQTKRGDNKDALRISEQIKIQRRLR